MEIRPNIAPGCHPVLTGDYDLPTNAIDSMGQDLLKWIRNRTPGGIVTGRPRLGKTRAVRFLAKEIPSMLQDKVSMFILNCNSYRFSSENSFFTDILLDLGHAVPTGQPSMKRQRICNFLIAEGMESTQRKVILLADEAQNWNKLEFKWLVDMYNQLDKHQINLTVFLVGQPELLEKKKSFIAEEMHQVVGRFMVQEHKFHGVQGLDDLATCLASYDEESEFPPGSGWSFTRYFFPEQFSRGFRLADCAEDLWEVFEYAHNQAGLGTRIEIPMQYIAVTVQYVLTTFGADGSNVRRLSKSHWKEAAEESGYVLAERTFFNKKWDEN